MVCVESRKTFLYRQSSPQGELLLTAASVAQGKLGEFNSQDIAKTVWAFAKVKMMQEVLMIAVANMAETRFGRSLR